MSDRYLATLPVSQLVDHPQNSKVEETNEDRAFRFMEMYDREKQRALTRRRSGKRQKLEEKGCSAEIAAKSVGWSRHTAQRAVMVIEEIGKLSKAGKTQQAVTLRNLLSAKSVRAAHLALLQKKPCIEQSTYFIRCGETGPIKVGMSSEPTVRLKALQTGCPYRLKLLNTARGNWESYFKSMFEEECIRGEWFRPTVGLIDTIEFVVQHHGGERCHQS